MDVTVSERACTIWLSIFPFQGAPVLLWTDLTFSERACAVWAIDLTASERACTVWLSILLLQNAPVLFLDDALTLGESGPADLRPADPLPDTTAATLSLWTPP